MTESASTMPSCKSRSETDSLGVVASRRPRHLVRYAIAFLFAAAIIFRLAVTILPGDQPRTPWGGGGDTSAYVLLAQNIAQGKGYAYAGWPTAYRPPVYPLLLAALVKLFGAHALSVMRGLQFCVGLLVAYFCSQIAGAIFGKSARIPALLVALFCPTLVFMTGEILNETIAALFTVIFLYVLVLYWQKPSWTLLAGAALTAGFATLARFNMALFGIVLLATILWRKSDLPKVRSAAIAILLPALVVAPWLIRNFVVFHGAFVLSTEGGPTAAMGILTPQGRALPGDSERLSRALGWVPPSDIETNEPSRNLLPSESVLNDRAWKVTFGLWGKTGWSLIPLTLKKFGYFWLSTDQLLSTASFRMPVRIARGGGVAVYWLLLALAMVGWFHLRARNPSLAYLLLFYCTLVTVLHAPFDMNTRLRIPFVDPLLAVLAGEGLLGFVAASNLRRDDRLEISSEQLAVRLEARTG